MGKTTACLFKRLDKELGGTEKSAAHLHTKALGKEHSFSAKNAQILCGNEKINSKLEMKETLFIHKLKPELNRNVASRTLKLL